MVTPHAYTSTGSLPPHISEVRSGSKRHVMERIYDEAVLPRILEIMKGKYHYSQRYRSKSPVKLGGSVMDYFYLHAKQEQPLTLGNVLSLVALAKERGLQLGITFKRSVDLDLHGGKTEERLSLVFTSHAIS